MSAKAWDGRAPAGPVLGTMTWGREAQVREKEAGEMLANLVEACEEIGCDPILDTARVYQAGQTEELIGTLLKQEGQPWSGKNIQVHTKAAPVVTPLSAEGVRKQLEDSLKALQMDCVHVFYLHLPEMRVDVEETLEACNELYKEGKFEELGLSNFAAWDVVRIVHLCETRGWVAPTVYQGVYSGLNRTLEPELFPALRTLGMRIYAYNPLAGGLLTGRYSSMEDITEAKEGRFSSQFDFVPSSIKTPMSGQGHKLYRARYGHELNIDACNLIAETVGKDKMVEKAFAWIRHHSYISGSDGIIFGASKPSHCASNLACFCDSEPLSENEVAAFKEAAKICFAAQESYTRSYGRLPGGSEVYMEKFTLGGSN
ncbi:Aflatoxin B1 aldehyde reductase member 3 [Hondaea fermentalgiana]|uniref:Aflatoxin B1 aldehyde reductase member 3 n=1 Tax=Hondaea fermentalgiana TaxID=2315210 RepID=A0A2R5GC01_9STRA|nr:Aflatoxin B1 aldehyde reductase member 3 [Hondaea fermentalgiana]|eukprot:GBG27238.1 Aflatoxin B1 aldehyde reductase member 3 [Hondaea fermentalgiana]